MNTTPQSLLPSRRPAETPRARARRLALARWESEGGAEADAVPAPPVPPTKPPLPEPESA